MKPGPWSSMRRRPARTASASCWWRAPRPCPHPAPPPAQMPASASARRRPPTAATGAGAATRRAAPLRRAAVRAARLSWLRAAAHNRTASEEAAGRVAARQHLHRRGRAGRPRPASACGRAGGRRGAPRARRAPWRARRGAPRRARPAAPRCRSASAAHTAARPPCLRRPAHALRGRPPGAPARPASALGPGNLVRFGLCVQGAGRACCRRAREAAAGRSTWATAKVPGGRAGYAERAADRAGRHKAELKLTEGSVHAASRPSGLPL